MQLFVSYSLYLIVFRLVAGQSLRPVSVRWGFWVPIIIPVVVSLVLASSLSAMAAGPIAGFDWSMPDRFGLDENGDGLLDIIHDSENQDEKSYTQRTSFTVNFNSSTSVPGTSPIVSYTWIIQGNGLSSPITLSGPSPSVDNLHEGSYSVTLTVTDANGQISTSTKTVVVKDVLIVSIGDSYASGEGNPDIPQRFDDFGFVKAGARWTDSEQNQDRWGDNHFHSRCHRSQWAGPVQAALSYEQSDPHTSVTFVSVACSGATIEQGLLGNYRGVEEPHDGSELPPQLDQVAAIVGNRRIDGLIISVGGNDIGFSNVVKALVMLGPIPHGYDVPLPGLGFLSWDQAIGPILSTLSNLYASLNTRIHQKLNVSNVYITEYPDPTHDADGQTCHLMLEDVIFEDFIPGDLSLIGIDTSEAEWARGKAIEPLNQAIQTAADSHRWNFVSGISADFLTHGYCAYNLGLPYLIQADESRILQGPTANLLFPLPTEKGRTTGTLHPNILGHRVYRDHLLQHLDFTPPEITCPSSMTVPTAAGLCIASVNYTAPLAIDNFPGVRTNCTPAAGSNFQKGTTTVGCTATDTAGNEASCNFNVTVIDREAPSLICPAIQIAPATSPVGAVVNYPFPTITDNCPGITTSQCSPASASTFPIGITPVSCNATDNSGNQASCGFDVKVKGAAEQATDLTSLIKSYQLQKGIENSLLVKLQGALAAIQAGNTAAACGTLTAFINEVNAQTGKKITAGQAAEMLIIARRIKAVLSCP